MAGGNSNLENSDSLDNENDDIYDEGTKSGFDDARGNPESKYPIQNTCTCVLKFELSQQSYVNKIKLKKCSNLSLTCI